MIKVGFLLLLLVVLAYQYPINPNCPTATVIPSLPYNSGSRTTFTEETDTICDEERGANIWFKYSSNSNERVDISVCSADFDTFLYVISGSSCSTYSCIARDDDACRPASKIESFNLYVEDYYFVVSGFYFTDFGTFELTISPSGYSADIGSCTSAFPSDLISFFMPFVSNRDLTSFASPSACHAAPTLWYSFTPLSTVAATVSTCANTNFDSVLSIATGSCSDTLSCLNNADNGCGTNDASITRTFSKGVNYFILVSGFEAATGHVQLSITPAAPDNDACAGALPILALPFRDFAYFTGASQDFVCNGDSGSTTSSGNDVWWQFASTESVPNLVISSCYSPVQTSVYLSSGGCGNLQCWMSDSSSCPWEDSVTTGFIQTTLAANTLYYFTLSPVSPTASGYVQLDVFVPPGNDHCADAIVFNSLPFTYEGNNLYSLPDSFRNDGPHCIYSNQSPTVFFTFTPTGDWKDVVIQACDSDYDNVIYLATGSCERAECLNDGDNECGWDSVGAYIDEEFFTAGQTYLIAVGGYGPRDFGSFVLSVFGTQYDSCADAREIPSLPFSYASDNSANLQEILGCEETGYNVMWFHFAPLVDYQNVFIDICSAQFDSILYVYSGSCGTDPSFTCIAVSDDFDYCLNNRASFISGVVLEAEANYYIAVAGKFYEEKGVFTLNVSPNVEVVVQTPINGTVNPNQLANIAVSGTASGLFVGKIVYITLEDQSSRALQFTSIVNSEGRWAISVPSIVSFQDGEIDITALVTGPNSVSGFSYFYKDTSTFVSISTPTSGSVLNQASVASFSVTGTGEARGTVIVRISDGTSAEDFSITLTVSDNGSWESSPINISRLGDGAIRVVASITDVLGNTAVSSTVTVTKDTVVTARISSPSDFQFLVSQARASTLAISGFSDVGARVTVSVVDSVGARITTPSPPVTVSPVGTWSVRLDVTSLAEGNLAFTATASDGAGNTQNSQTINLKKDTMVSPATMVSSPTPAYRVGSSLTVSGTAEEGARVALRVSGSSGVISRTVNVGAGGGWTTTVSISTFPNGNINIGGMTTDAAGNSATITPITVIKA